MSNDGVDMTMTIDGIDYPVELDRHHRFTVSLGEGHQESAETWSDLEARLTKRVRKSRVRVRVPFVTENGARGTAYQIHAGSQNPLVEWADGTKGQDNVRAPLSADTDVDELHRLINAAAAAQKALRDFRAAHRLPRLSEEQKSDYNLLEYVKIAVVLAQRAAEERAAAKAVTDGTTPVDLDA